MVFIYQKLLFVAVFRNLEKIIKKGMVEWNQPILNSDAAPNYKKIFDLLRASYQILKKMQKQIGFFL